jgi:hypothetical protein
MEVVVNSEEGGNGVRCTWINRAEDDGPDRALDVVEGRRVLVVVEFAREDGDGRKHTEVDCECFLSVSVKM